MMTTSPTGFSGTVGSAAVRPDGVRLGELLTLTAQQSPNKPCFLYPDGTHHTFAEINSRVNRLADALRRSGVKHGDRLAIFALDSHRYIEIVLAAMKLGAIYVPLNYRLARNEVEVLLDRSTPTALFYDTRYESLLQGIEDGRAGLPLVHALDERPGESESDYERLLATGDDVEPIISATDDDIIALCFTSGTTGLPKGALQSQGMVKRSFSAGNLESQIEPNDVRYTAAPMFHVTGTQMVLHSIACGYTSLITPQFDPATTLRFLIEDRLTAVFLVPTMISMLLQQPGVDNHAFERLRLIIYGASPMSPALLRRASDVFGCDFLNMFGAGTEAMLQTVLRPDDHRRALAGEPELLGSIGKPAYGVALRLVDEHMRDVPPGEVGEIVTRSDTVMSGYLDMPEETARVFRDGWFGAGDMAYQGKNGYLYLSGRKKDMIIRGGENIYPDEIESVLAEHAAVLQSAVVGVPDEHWGETVRAFVVLREGYAAAVEELTEHCQQLLAKFKVPAEFIFLDVLPTNASGKILKRELREWV